MVAEPHPCLQHLIAPEKMRTSEPPPPLLLITPQETSACAYFNELKNRMAMTEMVMITGTALTWQSSHARAS